MSAWPASRRCRTSTSPCSRRWMCRSSASATAPARWQRSPSSVEVATGQVARMQSASVRWWGWLAVVCLGAPPAVAAPDPRLADAVKRRDRHAVERLLEQKADVDVAQPDGTTALQWAVHWDDAALVAELLRRGANAKTANDLGVTPLSLACTNGNAAVVTALLAAGADVNVVVGSGETVLMTCARTGNLESVKAVLARR